MTRFPHSGLSTVFLAVLALLVGCATTPTRAPIDAPLPETFSAGGRDALPDRWWTTLADPRLDALIERALSDNPTLLAARDRLDQASALARGSGATRWPSVDAEIGGTRTGVHTEGDATGWTNTLSLGVQASYEVDLWGRVDAVADASALDAAASREDLHAAAVTLSASVAETWYQLAAARESLALLRAQLAVDEQTLAVVRAQYANGQVGVSDILQQRQQIESKRGEIALAESSVAVLITELTVLLGEAPGSGVVPTDGALCDLPPLPAAGVPADLVRRRPDVRAGFTRILAADARAAAAAADRFPRLSLSASGSTDAENAGGLFDTWIANLVANLTAPIFDGGARGAEADRTRSAAEETLHDYGALVLDAVAEVENALIQEDRQAAYLASLDRQLELAGQTVERIRQRYLNGDADYLRVLDAVKSEQSLARSRIEAKRQLISYRIQLCRALAGGWDLDTDGEGSSDRA